MSRFKFKTDFHCGGGEAPASCNYSSGLQDGVVAGIRRRKRHETSRLPGLQYAATLIRNFTCPSGAPRLWAGTALGASVHGYLQQSLQTQRTGGTGSVKQPVPDAVMLPAQVADIGCVPAAKLDRHLPPPRAGNANPQHRIHKQPVVFRGNSAVF